MVCVYLRVSTHNQDSGLDSQGRAIEVYCKAHGLEVFKVFKDAGVSGAKQTRPGLDELMATVHQGSVSTVVVYSFSRFARSVKHLLAALEVFESKGIKFVSISEQLDTGTTTGRFVFTILAAMAAMERELIVDRVKNGLANARAKGKRIGAPKKALNQDLINQLKSQGLTYREIGSLVGCSSATVCRRISERQDW